VVMTPHLRSTHLPLTFLERASGDTFQEFTNYQNFYYTVPFWLAQSGTTLVNFNLLFDTGSPQVTLGVKGCTGCKGKLYDNTQSSTFQWTAYNETIKYYDGTSYSGRRCLETTCSDNTVSACMP
jgi:hypothetical protein